MSSYEHVIIRTAARDAGTFLRDALDLLAGHFEKCPYMRHAQDFLTGRILTCPRSRKIAKIHAQTAHSLVF